MPNLRNTGLQGRAIVFCVTLLCCAVAAVSGTLLYLDSVASTKSITREGLVLAASLSFNAEPGMLLNDKQALERVVNGAGRDENISLARVIDTRGQIAAEYTNRTDAAPGLSVDLASPLGPCVSPDSSLVRLGKYELLVVVPIWPNSDYTELVIEDDAADSGSDQAEQSAIGYVQLIYTLDRIRAGFRAKMFASVAIALLVTVLGVATVLIGTRQFLLPMAHLVETAGAIAKGDLRRRASEDAVGEVGILARAFNHMTDRLRKSYESIEQKVQKRTAELVRANKAKSDFLANMSHEIRTPLTAILGFAESLLEPDMSESARVGAVATIRRNGDHLLQIIGDILDISRIEAGQLTVENLECDVPQLVADVESVMQSRARVKGLTFYVEYVGPIPATIRTDPTRLRQILINLLGNAIKFTHRGGVRLRVGLAAEPAGVRGDHLSILQFAVIDTGIGMTPEQVEKIFKPFTQADETMTRRFGGTGLGLTISKRLAEMLGGNVSVASRPGAGSTFTVTIAAGSLAGIVMLEDPAVAMSVRADRPVDSTPDQGVLACRILLAEDGPDNQLLIAHLLRRAKAEVTVVDNGQLAVDATFSAEGDGRPYDVILMDMQMPVMDGYEATRLIRAKGYRRPIVALTAHAMAGEREKCLAAGCDEYATKPIDRRKLMQVIRAQMGRQENKQANPPAGKEPLISELADDADMMDLVNQFATELPARAEALHRAIVQDDIEGLARLAHQLKGSAGSYGFSTITEAAGRLERSAKAQEALEGLAEAVKEITELCHRAHAGRGLGERTPGVAQPERPETSNFTG